MNKSFIEQATLQAAFIAISSRIVGSAFRCLETLNPNYQQSQVISNPRTVCIRELSTICMAFGFSLITSAVIKPRAKVWGWSDFKVQMLTSIIGTFIAESIGRLIAYRKASLKSRSSMTPALPTAPNNYSAMTIPSTSILPISRTPTAYSYSSAYFPASSYATTGLRR